MLKAQSLEQELCVWHHCSGIREKERNLSLLNFPSHLPVLPYCSHLFGFTFFNSSGYPALLCSLILFVTL